ncbi:hypothetical protein [Micromonospora sp. NPDC005161]
MSDGGDSGQAEQADRGVAQGGHHAGCVAGADAAGVFAVGGVADVMQDFDGPMSAQPVGQVGGAGLGGGQVRDRVDGDGGPAAGGQVEPAAADPQGLNGVWEVQGERPGARDRLQAADVVAAVAAFAGLVLDRDLRPGQGLSCRYKRGWFFFTVNR